MQSSVHNQAVGSRKTVQRFRPNLHDPQCIQVRPPTTSEGCGETRFRHPFEVLLGPSCIWYFFTWLQYAAAAGLYGFHSTTGPRTRPASELPVPVCAASGTDGSFIGPFESFQGVGCFRNQNPTPRPPAGGCFQEAGVPVAFSTEVRILWISGG